MKTALLLFAITCLSSETLSRAATEVEIDLSLDRGMYPYLAESHFYLVAQIKTGVSETIPPHPPLNVCIVLDRSGSMAGDRILSAKKFILQSLNYLSQSDILSVVTFGSSTETPIPAQHVDRLENFASKIQAIESVGGAALYDGLNQAAAQLRRYRTENSLNCIVLISDGPPTRGPREIDDFVSLAKSFASENLTITAVGIGNEINQELLSSLSRITNGSYSSISDGSDLTEVLNQEFDQLKSPIARNIQLEIKFRPSIEIEESLSTGATIRGRSLQYHWDTLYSNQKIEAIVSGKILADGADDRFGKLSEATLRYTPVGAENRREITLNASAEASFVDSRRLSAESINRPALRTALAHEIALSISQASDFSDEGKIDKAIRELRNSLNALKSINRDLEDNVVDSQLQDIQIIYDQFASRSFNLIESKVLTERRAASPPKSESKASAQSGRSSQ